MIKKHKGNILTVSSGYIIHGCNAKGVMGSGIAKTLRTRYPSIYTEYSKKEQLIVGTIIPVYVTDKLCIINAITQQTYGRNENVVYVSYPGLIECFDRVNRLIQTGTIEKSLHFPKIGAGLAKGNWNLIYKYIDRAIPDFIDKNLWIL